MSEDRLLRCSLFRSFPFWPLHTKGKLAPEQRLEELSTHFWGNSLTSVLVELFQLLGLKCTAGLPTVEIVYLD